MAYPVSFPVPNSCRIGEDCELELVIRLVAKGDDAPIDGPVELRPTWA